MAVTNYTLAGYDYRHEMEKVIRDIVGDCRCIKDIQITRSPMSACCQVQVSRIDTGIWEWNDNVIA